MKEIQRNRDDDENGKSTKRSDTSSPKSSGSDSGCSSHKGPPPWLRGEASSSNDAAKSKRVIETSSDVKVKHENNDLSQEGGKIVDVGSSSDSSKSIEIPANFEHAGGNTDLANAQIILLGEYHITQHREDIVNFINAHAKEGDIVLDEGIQSGEKHKLQKEMENQLEGTIEKWISLGHITTDRVADIMEEGKKKIYSVLVDKNMLPPFREDIEKYGWDDMDAYNREGQTLLTIGKILSYPEDSRLAELRKNLFEIAADLSIRRDEKMLETINKMKAAFPNKAIFVIAGERHTESSVVQENLERYPYIVLKPNYKPTEEDIKNNERAFSESAWERQQHSAG